jgi:ABC-type polysaccharide/polyol phosphate transport system ATPase subunit
LTRGHATKKFWALQNVSFEIDKGAIVGIVGPNGCGNPHAANYRHTLEPAW